MTRPCPSVKRYRRRARFAVATLAAMFALATGGPFAAAAAESNEAASPQTAQIGAPGAEAQAAGVIQRVKGKAELFQKGRSKAAVPGDTVYQSDRVVTGAGSQALIELRDGTAFTIGPNADLRLDSFVYDPNANIGTSVTSIARGAFHLVSGLIPKKSPGAAQIKLPVGTIGIRGTVAAGNVTGQSAQVLLLDPQNAPPGGALVVQTPGGEAQLVLPMDGLKLDGTGARPVPRQWTQEEANALLAELGMKLAAESGSGGPAPASPANVGPVRFSAAECRAIVNRIAKLDLGMPPRPAPADLPPSQLPQTDVTRIDFERYGVPSAAAMMDATKKRVGVVRISINKLYLNDVLIPPAEAQGVVRLCRDRFNM